MRHPEPPILRTHVANIALNKAIALAFLLSDAQETHGLTEYSGESYVNDKLHVALWMIERFTKFDKSIEPWVSLPEYEIPENSMDSKAFHEFDGLIEEIQKERNGIPNIWDFNDTSAVTFLKKIIAQTQECIWYTNQRLEAILLFLEMSNNPDAIMKASPKLTEQIFSSPILQLGGYLKVKNEMNGKRILAKKLLEIILAFLVPKAIKEGYIETVSELA